MGKETRTTLKSKFGKGQMPTAGDFSNLIDSHINLIDDDFRLDKEYGNGWEICPRQKNTALLSFRAKTEGSESNNKKAIWSFYYEEGGQLTLRCKESKSKDKPPQEQIRFTENSIRMGMPDDKLTLDVNGTVRSTVRVGKKGSVPADGKFHTIGPKIMSGELQAFELVAVVGPVEPRHRYAMMQTTAICTYSPRLRYALLSRLGKVILRKVKCQQQHSGSHCDRLDLRCQYKKDDDKWSAQLVLRSNCAYHSTDGSNFEDIYYHLTALWPPVQGDEASSARNHHPGGKVSL